jgi:hypothetical protein
MRRRIETTIKTLSCTKSDAKKWLHFLKEREISKPKAELDTMVLTDSKYDDDDLCSF